MTSTLPISDDELPALFAGLERVPLALAVSGGADSMALMHLIARWAAREDVRAAWASDAAAAFVPHVVVMTVDHGLRVESADEAAFVAREAQKLSLPCQVLRWEGEKPATGIQAGAREARRALLVDAVHDEAKRFTSLAQAQGMRLRPCLRALVMAHHLEDQAETFLMRLARGSGLDGLRGTRSRDLVMRAATAERPRSYSVELLRPLLGVPKARLVATLQAYGARWIEDPSNDDERFERVRIRKTLQQLEPLGFTAEKIALSARRLADAELSLRYLVEEWVKPPYLAKPHWLYGELEIGGPLFASAYFGVRTLRQMLCSYGGASREPELSQLEELFQLARSTDRREAHRGSTLGGCIVEFRGESGGILRIFREGSGEGLPVVPLDPGQAVDWDGGRFTVEAGTAAPTGAVVRALGMQGWADLKRAVKGLGDLGWPAAAVATVPVIECGGGIIAYPVIDRAVRLLPEEKRQIKERWAAFASGLGHAEYSVSFRPRPW